MHTIRVDGIEPAPQGSKRAIALRKGGSFTGKVALLESSAGVKPWREAVRQEVIRSGLALLEVPVGLSVEFRLTRPRSHHTSKGALKKGAPRHHRSKPDTDKLLRSTFDGLTGAAFKDDSQVMMVSAVKRYCEAGERPGAIIMIWALD
jgi:crossover junction endodeoxyribonuclease RusA